MQDDVSSRDGDVVRVLDGRTDRDGLDVLLNIERLRFADTTMDLS